MRKEPTEGMDEAWCGQSVPEKGEEDVPRKGWPGGGRQWHEDGDHTEWWLGTGNQRE